MNHSGASLSDFFRSYADRGEPLALATIVETHGSTYRKAGAQMLFAKDGRAAGLLSGGCLEADLMEHARTIIKTGAAMRIEYDARSSDDLIWGLGLGCEGAMSIVLTRLGPENGYQPFAFIERCRDGDAASHYALIVRSADAGQPLGAAYWPGASAGAPAAIAQALAAPHPPRARCAAKILEADGVAALLAPIEPSPRLLVLGAGPDAMPLVEMAGLLSWRVTVLDHRAAYAVSGRFPRAQRVDLRPATELGIELAAACYDAAVVMSHHLLSDQAYLAALADSSTAYVGLLGPAARRARLMSDLGAKAARLEGRLHSPVGLDIGAITPEEIALAIVSEIQAALAGRPWRMKTTMEQ